MELVQPQHLHVNKLAILPNARRLAYGANVIKIFAGLPNILQQVKCFKLQN